MTEFEVDEEYIEEVNTSYDQDKEIGSIPSAYFAHSQPMNAKNGGDEKFESREKLNKDGTGVRKATRGLNPKKTPAKVLEFVYVSKSECEICRQYDGQIFAIDSPNRPIIPRLESQGKKGTRPYTHPNCKCKWVRPFSKTGLKNFGQTRGGEAEAYELKQKTIDMARQTIVDFDKLSKRDQYVAIAYMFKERLSSPESFDPTSLPIASMIKMTYDAIEPTLALQLAKMSHRDSNEVRDLIDDMVGESLSSERKHSIVLEHNLDFTFENLLKLTVTALEHDVWDENTNTLVDPTLLEDKSESDEGEFGFTDPEWDSFPKEVQDQLTTKVFKKEGLDDEEPYMPDVYGIDPYPHRHEFIDNVCIICDYVLKASEDYDDHSCPTCPDKPYDCCCLYCDTDITQYGSYDCKNCGRTKGNMHYGESKASEYHPLELDIVQKYEGSPIQVKNNMAQNMGFKNWKEMIGKLKMRIKLDENGDTFEELSDAERNAWLNIFELDPNTSSLYESKASEWNDREWNKKPPVCPNCNSIDIEPMTLSFDNSVWGSPYSTCNDCGEEFIEGFESKANEGGRGSGRKGHQKWMLGAEADPEECPNCMIFTEKKNGNCQICGNSY
jgi:hypothetical protein